MEVTTTLRRLILGALTVGIAVLNHAHAASTTTVDETINATAQPWLYVNGGLNTNFQFGVNDGSSPIVINASSGISFAAGGTITVTYLSGTQSAGAGFPAVDANGDSGFVFNANPGSSGNVAPSAYMNPSTYPIFLTELVGTFATVSGAIVGTPFKVGNGPAMLVVPSGATQLQLGVNDDIYSDNTGSWLVSVAGPTATAVAEPASLVMAAASALAGLGYAWRRNRSRLSSSSTR